MEKTINDASKESETRSKFEFNAKGEKRKYRDKYLFSLDNIFRIRINAIR